MSNAAICAEIWTKALGEEIGLSISIDPVDKRRFMNLLHKVRDDLGRPEFKDFRVCMPGGLDEVWIVRMTVDLDA